MRKHTDKVTCLAFLDTGRTPSSPAAEQGVGRVARGAKRRLFVVERRKKTPLRPDTSSTPRVGSCVSGSSSALDAHDEHEHAWVPAKRVVAPGGAIRALCVSRGAGADRDAGKNAARVYTAGSDGAVRAWEVSDETRGFVLLRTFLGGHGGFGVCVFAIRLPKATSHDLPARRSRRGKADEEDAADAYEEYVLSGCEGPLAGGYWVEGDGSLKLWRAANGRCAQTVTLQKGNIGAIVRETAGDGGDGGRDPDASRRVFCRRRRLDGRHAWRTSISGRAVRSRVRSRARETEKKDDVDVVAKRTARTRVSPAPARTATARVVRVDPGVPVTIGIARRERAESSRSRVRSRKVTTLYHSLHTSAIHEELWYSGIKTHTHRYSSHRKIGSYYHVRRLVTFSSWPPLLAGAAAGFFSGSASSSWPRRTSPRATRTGHPRASLRARMSAARPESSSLPFFLVFAVFLGSRGSFTRVSPTRRASLRTFCTKAQTRPRRRVHRVREPVRVLCLVRAHHPHEHLTHVPVELGVRRDDVSAPPQAPRHASKTLSTSSSVTARYTPR